MRNCDGDDDNDVGDDNAGEDDGCTSDAVALLLMASEDGWGELPVCCRGGDGGGIDDDMVPSSSVVRVGVI